MDKDHIARMKAARLANRMTAKTPAPSRKAAIREKCKECIYDDCSPGTWLQQVTECESTDCALWKVRPTSKNQLRAGG